VHAIEDSALVLPDPLALDTSFVVEALIESGRLHAVCAGFAERITEAGVTFVTSELLEVEPAEASFAIALKERWGGAWRRHRTDGRSRRRARRLLNETTSRYEALRRSAAAHVSLPPGLRCSPCRRWRSTPTAPALPRVADFARGETPKASLRWCCSQDTWRSTLAPAARSGRPTAGDDVLHDPRRGGAGSFPTGAPYQVQLAHVLGISQGNVSRLEHRQQLYISTLREYVEALGGRLELAAVFGDERVPLAVGEQ
jgi:hypothetical protein